MGGAERGIAGPVADRDEQRLREQQARLVLDHMYQFVGLLDGLGRFIDANQTALDGAGIDRRDYAGRPFDEARWWQVSPETQERLREAIREASAGRFVRYDVDIFGAGSGDELITIDFNLNPLIDETGTVTHIIAEGRNITEQKLAEAEVARQTAQLQQLYERVRELDQLKTQFFANVSHELRTPLGLILGPVERLLADPAVATAEYRTDLEVVQRNARTVLKHVTDLLDISKLEAGRMVAQYSDCDLAELVRRCASHFDAVARERSVRLDVEGPESLPAQLDADKVERIVLNLLSNAFKFTPVGGSVVVMLRIRGAGGAATSRAVLTVADSGPGVPADQRELIFERFRQAEGGVNRRFGGTGLGLAIAKDFAELHGGTICVGEATAGGASFTLELPLHAPAGTQLLAPDHDPDAGLPSSAVPAVLDELRQPVPAQRALARTGRPLVLVVEDNPDMSRFVAAVVGREYDVAVAFDGAEGLEAALRLRPALILSDVMMPGTDGAAFLAAARTRPELDGTPFLLLTAKADAELAVRLLREGAQDHIAKPFSPAELMARIGLHLRAGVAAEAQAASLAVVAPDGRLLRANAALARLLRRPVEELLTLTLFDIVTPEERAPVAALLERLGAPGATPAQLDLVLSASQGIPRWATLVAVPGFDAEGALRHVSCQLHDVTQRTIESTAHLRLAFEAAEMGLWSWDLSSDEVTWSPEARRLMGVEPDQPATYELFTRLVHPDDLAAVEARLAHCRSTGKPLEIEYRVTRPDGSVGWLLSKGQLRGSCEDSCRMHGVLMDVTTRHRAEEERTQLLAAQVAAGERAVRVQLVTAALAGATTTDKAVEIITGRVRAALGADFATIALIDPTDSGVTHLLDATATPGSPQRAWDRSAAASGPSLHDLARTAVPEFTTGSAVAASGWAAYASLPLNAGGRIRGSWVLAWSQQRPFAEEERTFLVTLAAQAAQALERCALYEQEHDIATALQRTLLPARLPVVEGATLDARYLPGAAGVEVGGDWYDVIPLPGERLGLVVGDVEGHNVAAAAVMGQVRNALRAYAIEGHTPAGVMERVNRLLTTIDTGSLVTCCYLEFSPAGGTATAVLAGHPPPLLVSDEGSEFVRVEAGLVLGVDADVRYTESTVLVPPGSTLLLYTDGLVESPLLPLDQGLEELRTRAVHCANGRTQPWIDCLLSATLGGRGGGDDVAVLTLCRSAAQQPGEERCVSRRLPCDPTSAGAARRFLGDVLTQWDAEELTDTTAVMVSELVTNAVLHTTADLELCLRLNASHLRVEVRDRSERLPAVRHPGEEETGGRGMLIIEAMAEAWGIEPTASGKTVWFSVAREGALESV